jgi:hypothetical protein
MPISLAGIVVGKPYDRNDQLVSWGLSSSDNDDNLRCFYRTGNDIVVFITELNVGHLKSDRTHVNWLGPDTLRMEVHERDTHANEGLRRAGYNTAVVLFFRRRTGTKFTYLGEAEVQRRGPFRSDRDVQVHAARLFQCLGVGVALLDRRRCTAGDECAR